MPFVGLQRHSLIDYPGKLSCVGFVSGCNFRCPYCHNPDLVTGALLQETPPDEKVFFDFLERRRGILDGVVISGGEPTLVHGLPEVCERIKNMGFEVKLDTNGSRPRVIRRLVVDGLVDYIAMDLKTAPGSYKVVMNGGCRVGDIYESVRAIMESDLPYEFRTTCVRSLVGPDEMGDMAEVIQGAGLYILQPFHQSRILNPEYFCGIEPALSEGEMRALKSIAEPYVRECRIRPS